MTGSFFAAMRDGMRPARNVSSILIATRITAAPAGRAATPLRPLRWWMIALSGRMSSSVMPMPMAPAAKPMVSVSALKTREMSRREAPMERRTPISRVRYSTEI